MIEKTLEDMKERGILSELEDNVIWVVSAGYSYSGVGRLLSIHRLTVSEIFKKVTDRISYILGGELTDTAFISRIPAAELLSEKEISALFRKGIIKAKSDD